jgi:hypothetical protein
MFSKKLLGGKDKGKSQGRNVVTDFFATTFQ